MFLLKLGRPKISVSMSLCQVPLIDFYNRSDLSIYLPLETLPRREVGNKM